ncbi:hypothetical protein M513_09978 [Trichuris suis]|uniref:Uncharacterized protein n=1 Tax=Trichuris suis TaxID=68888 RepID=A0A085LW08_9BILA|nr:hypothetical protein M513_09978 [Trichuris suis]
MFTVIRRHPWNVSPADTEVLLYLDFSSHHPRSVMRGILSGMIDRAINLCNPEYLRPELNYIRKIFYINNYSRSFIDRVFQYKLRTRGSVKPSTLHNPCLVIPYVAGFGEKIVRLGRQLGFRVFFKSSPNLRSILRKDTTKIPTNKKTGLVYAVECACSGIYIGETGNTLEHRFKEHINKLTSSKNAKNHSEQ